MEDRAEALRRRIAHYRRLLEQGTAVDAASLYLNEIAKAYEALRALEAERESR